MNQWAERSIIKPPRKLNMLIDLLKTKLCFVDEDLPFNPTTHNRLKQCRASKQKQPVANMTLLVRITVLDLLSRVLKPHTKPQKNIMQSETTFCSLRVVLQVLEISDTALKSCNSSVYFSSVAFQQAFSKYFRSQTCKCLLF